MRRLSAHRALIVGLASLLPVILLFTARPLQADISRWRIGSGPVTLLAGGPEILALELAYAGRIDTTQIRDGEWALKMDGRWYYWADGRLLPRPHKETPEQFVSIRFYNHYEIGPPRLREVGPELEAVLRAYTARRDDDERVRFNGFLDTLYRISSRQDAERLMKPVSFLGMSTRVHPIVVGPLERVESRIREAMHTDGETRAFVEHLDQVHGYNWRRIAGTARRSYHSYGVAVDLLPARYTGGWAYWRWAADSGVTEWWDIPFARRWQIPRPIIDAFEAEGFVWGGKWLFFDNVHFEYRPESIILAHW
jgi:hypothetical protein